MSKNEEERAETAIIEAEGDLKNLGDSTNIKRDESQSPRESKKESFSMLPQKHKTDDLTQRPTSPVRRSE